MYINKRAIRYAYKIAHFKKGGKSMSKAEVEAAVKVDGEHSEPVSEWSVFGELADEIKNFYESLTGEGPLEGSVAVV